MDGNTKKAENDAGNCEFVVGGTAFSTICRSNTAILYIMGVEVTWGNFLMEFMGCIDSKARGMYDGTVRVDRKVEDEFLDTL